MGSVKRAGLQRRFVYAWYLISLLTGVLSVCFMTWRKSQQDRPETIYPDSTTTKDEFIFGECFTDSVLFLLAFAINLGMVVWVTFIASIIMYKNLPTETFGHIQSKLFPAYFLVGAICTLLQLAVAVYSTRNIGTLSWEHKAVLISLVATLLPNIINGMWVGPRSAEIMLARHKMVKETNDKSKLEENEEYKKIKKEFGKMHGISSSLNLFVIAGISFVFYWLSSKFHVLAKN